MNLVGDMEHALAPEPMSKACARYFAEQAHLYSFQYFLLDLVKYKDHTAIAATEALIKTAKSNEDLGRHLSGAKDAYGAFRRFNEFYSLLAENWLCRTVDSYLAYASELLSLVFLTNPKMLKSRETISVDEILSHASMEQLIETIAEQKVHQLSYRGLSELSDYLRDRMAFPLFVNQAELDLARRYVEVRNLIVHNRGVVSKISASRLPEMAPLVGTRIELGFEEAISAAAVFARSVADLENRAAQKFGILQPIKTRDELVKQMAAELKDKREKAMRKGPKGAPAERQQSESQSTGDPSK